MTDYSLSDIDAQIKQLESLKESKKQEIFERLNADFQNFLNKLEAENLTWSEFSGYRSKIKSQTNKEELNPQKLNRINGMEYARASIEALKDVS